MAPVSSTPEKAVLLTRPLEDSRRIAEALETEGIAAEIWPLTRIVPVAEAIRLPPTVDGVIATSAHGIRAFAALAGRRDLPVLAVGARTAEVARGLGFRLVLSADGDAEALASLARGTGLRHLFHPRGGRVARDMAALLAANGQHVSEAVVYRAEETGEPPAPVAHALATGRVGLVTVWSPRNAALILARLAPWRGPAPPPAVLAISPRAAETLADGGLGDILTAERPDSSGMLAGIRAARDAGYLGGGS